jgi:hypothetical protein
MKKDIFFTNVNQIGKTHEPIQKFAKGDRITPSISATTVVEGTIAVSDVDGRLCYTKADKNGTGRWYRFDMPYDFNNLPDFKLSQRGQGTKGAYDGNIELEWLSQNDYFTFRLIVSRVDNFYYYWIDSYWEDTSNNDFGQIILLAEQLIETKKSNELFSIKIPEEIEVVLKGRNANDYVPALDLRNGYFDRLKDTLSILGVMLENIGLFQKGGWFKGVFGDLPISSSRPQLTSQDTNSVPKDKNTPEEIVEWILNQNTSKMWAKQPTDDDVKRAIYSKRKTEAQKVILAMAFGTLKNVDINSPYWSQFVENAEKIGITRNYGNETTYYRYEQKIPLDETIGIFHWLDMTPTAKDFIVNWLYKSWGGSFLSDDTQKDAIWQMYLNQPKTTNEVDMQQVYQPIIDENKKQDEIASKTITHSKTTILTPLKELQNEYDDVMFLISVTPKIEFDKILELKKIAKELKEKIDQLSLEEKDKLLKENRIFDELFIASSIQPKHRYDLKPDPNGFAPDGTPTQLPKSIYELTQTDDFEKWFGDFQLAYNFKNSPYTEVPCSLIKNVHYEPQIVFHGTGSQFSYFDFSKFPIMYFAENYAYAEWFAEQKGAQQGHNGYVYPFMLNIRNPLDLTHFGIDEITPQEFVDWLYLQTGLEADELKINPAVLSSNNPTWAWVYLRNGEEMLNVIRELNLFDGIIYYENNPPINTTAPNYKTKGFIIFEPNSAKIVDPERHSLVLPSMRSFYFKKGGSI